MTYAGWIGIWNSAVALVGHAPFAIQLVVWLGLAFATTMCLEGIRVSLLPRRWLAPRMARSPFVIPPESERLSPLQSIAAPAAYSPEVAEKPLRRPGKPVPPGRRMRPNRKKVNGLKRRTKPIKPKITRYPADPALPAMETFELSTSDIASEPMHDVPFQM